MLLFLSLLASALAAPQYYSLPAYGYAQYPAYPAYSAPLLYYPQALAYPTPAKSLQASTRTLGNFMQITGEFMPDTATMRTIEGTLKIHQNGIFDFFTGQDAKFHLYVKSSDDLNGKSLMIKVGTGADCTAASAAPDDLAMVTAPPSINGFYIKGTTKGYNIDGSGGKKKLVEDGMMKWLMITDSDGMVIGCSKAALST